MEPPLVISVAVTGGEHGREATPHLPITPLEIAEAAYEAAQAGAAIVHVHVRDDEGRPCHDLDRYRFVIDYLDERCDVIVNLTTDPGGDVEGADRLRSLDLAPELATFDAGTLTAPVGERVVFGGVSFLSRLAVRMKEVGAKPELEIFHSGMIGTCLQLAREGLIDEPLYFQFVLGVPNYAPASASELLHLVSMIPAGSPWSVTGIGRHSTPLAMIGMALGGNVRVGLEDSVYYEKGVLAKSNAELVARIVRLADELGRPVASPSEARRILGLKPSVDAATEALPVDV
jgi:3-keto-5-aminohexanoate cleavage enzyme